MTTSHKENEEIPCCTFPKFQWFFRTKQTRKKNRKQSFSDKKVFRDIADQIDVCKRKSETGLSLLAYWHLLPVNSHVVLDSTG